MVKLTSILEKEESKNRKLRSLVSRLEVSNKRLEEELEILVGRCTQAEKDKAALKDVEQKFKKQLLMNLELEHCMASMRLQQNSEHNSHDSFSSLRHKHNKEMTQLRNEFDAARKIGQQQLDELRVMNQNKQAEIDRLTKIVTLLGKMDKRATEKNEIQVKGDKTGKGQKRHESTSVSMIGTLGGEDKPTGMELPLGALQARKRKLCGTDRL